MFGDGSDIDVGADDILEIHAGVARRGSGKFRMRVQRRAENAAADVVVTGPAFTASGLEGRVRTVVLVSAADYTTIARPRTEAEGYLDVPTLLWLGQTPRSKWSQMAGWYGGAGKLNERTHLACVVKDNGTVGPLLGGNYRTVKLARARVLEALAEGTTREGWVLTAEGAQRVDPQDAA